jgi:glycosyltransferase involved in cell wall biosynthesis
MGPVRADRAALNVVHVLGGGRAGGAELYFCKLMAQDWAAVGVDNVPVVRAGGWAAAELTRRGIAHHTARFGGWWDVLGRWRLRCLLHELQPQVVVAWMNRAAKAVPTGPWTLVGRLGGYYKLGNYRKMAGLVVNTPDLLAYVRRHGWGEDRAQLLANFVEGPPAGWEEARVGLRAAARARWSIPPEAQVGLVAGRLHPVKGVDVALRALAQLPEHHWLLVAGEGPEEAALRALASELGVAERVVWAGWVNPLTEAAAAADVWLLPSRHEPLGNSVLDGLVHGRPVLASLTPGPEWLLTDGVNGQLLPIDDVAAWAAAWRQVADDAALSSRLAQGGVQRAKDFAAPLVLAAWVAYYQTMIQGASR